MSIERNSTDDKINAIETYAKALIESIAKYRDQTSKQNAIMTINDAYDYAGWIKQVAEKVITRG